jgi:hypothetical protein
VTMQVLSCNRFLIASSISSIQVVRGIRYLIMPEERPRGAAEWLLARAPSAVAFDFPPDYPIRLLLEGKSVPKEEHVMHDVLLKNGVTLIEYLVNTSALDKDRPKTSQPQIQRNGKNPYRSIFGSQREISGNSVRMISVPNKGM